MWADHIETTTERTTIQCHYQVLEIPLDADVAAIKKAHRQKALQYHPDKNLNDPGAHDRFRRIQEAYECLSDPLERKWYDEHREAILKGWSATSSSGGDNEQDVEFVFNIVPFMYAGCYNGYDDSAQNGFYQVYRSVFHKIYESDVQPSSSNGATTVDSTTTLQHIPPDFGTSDTPWDDVAAFYRGWESFISAATFSWADVYDVLRDAPDRRVRRLMEDENRKARRTARKSRNDDILALVRFVKRRDPRVKARKQQLDEEKARKDEEQKQQAVRRKQEAQQAREEWRQRAEEELAAVEEEDRLAGRIRLADLEDDYHYSGKKGKKGRKKKEKKNQSQTVEDDDEEEDDPAAGVEGETSSDHIQDAENPSTQSVLDDEPLPEPETNDPASRGVNQDVDETENDNDDDDDEEDEGPDIWRCECCKKDFKSEGQMENHMKSKKHKAIWKKYTEQLAKSEP